MTEFHIVSHLCRIFGCVLSHTQDIGIMISEEGSSIMSGCDIEESSKPSELCYSHISRWISTEKNSFDLSSVSISIFCALAKMSNYYYEPAPKNDGKTIFSARIRSASFFRHKKVLFSRKLCHIINLQIDHVHPFSICFFAQPKAFWLKSAIYEKVCDEVNMSKTVVDFEEMTKSGANLLPFSSVKNNAK